MLVNIVRSESSEIVAILYWIDETKYVKLRNMYEQSRPVACIVMIDNYDEVMQNTPDDSRAILMGTVEKKITDWANMSSGIIKKVEREKYFIVFEYRFLKQFTESKFDILDSVKSIQFGNKIPVTVSIGIGTEGDSLLQDDGFARTAIDMALGRGGDQVVIKNKKKFSYFGGNSKEIEKYTRVKTRVMAYALKQLISQADQIMIMGHKNADLDSFGAAIGMLSAEMCIRDSYDMVLCETDIKLDCDFSFMLSSSGALNYGKFSMPEMDGILTQINAANDMASRAQLMQQFQTIFAEQMPQIPLYFANKKIYYNTKLLEQVTAGGIRCV